jgi:hypothetical protein
VGGVLLAGLFPLEWLHPGGSGYWFYSGVFDAGILIGVFSGIGVFWRAHNCHVNGCWRLDWHPHPDHGHPVCLVHHPEGGSEFLRARHHRVNLAPGASEAKVIVDTEPAGGTAAVTESMKDNSRASEDAA